MSFPASDSAQNRNLISMRTVAIAESTDDDAESDGLPAQPMDQRDVDATLAALQKPEIAAALSALAALQQPAVAAALGVLRRYSSQQREAPRPISRNFGRASVYKKVIKPIVRNNLFVTTVAWTLLGLFLLYAADKNSTGSNAALAIFGIYGIVQCTLAVFILRVTSKQISKVHNRSITLGFLIQGWMALVFTFAGLYMFFQHAYTIGLQTTSDEFVRAALLQEAVRVRSLTLLQELTTASRATAFASPCIQLPNQTVTEASKSFVCVPHAMRCVVPPPADCSRLQIMSSDFLGVVL
jgi:hypothetical protein